MQQKHHLEVARRHEMSCTAKLGREDAHYLGDDMQDFLGKNAGVLWHKYLAYLIIEAANYMIPLVLVNSARAIPWLS